MPVLLQINTIVNSGSTGCIAEEIGKLAINEEWQSYIAYGRHSRKSKSQLIKIGTWFDVLLHGIETRFFDRHGMASRKATKELIRQIEIINPDIIHLHNMHGYYLNIENLFNYLCTLNIPVIWTLHDSWPLTGHCTNFEVASCEKWKSMCYSCPERRKYPASLFSDRSEKNYLLKKNIFTSLRNLTLVVVSQWMKDFLPYSFMKEYTTEIIRNGIDINVFRPLNDNELRKELKIENSFVLLGVANNWKLKKGFEDFLELSKLLPDHFRIILLGLDRSEMKKLPSNILGFKKTESVERLVEFYSAADLFVNPTREDNFPTTNLEALACGTPVITYRTGGCAEAVTDQTGFVVEKGDLKSLIDVLEVVRIKGKDAYSKACRERAIFYFNKNDRYQEYIALYNKLLNR